MVLHITREGIIGARPDMRIIDTRIGATDIGDTVAGTTIELPSPGTKC